MLIHEKSPHITGSPWRLLRNMRRTLFFGFSAMAALAMFMGMFGSTLAQGSDTTSDIPDNLEAPAGNVLLFELDAQGVQIYACEAKPDDATAFVWTFKAPEADLFNSQGVKVGQHFGGPTWEGLDGSAVIGKSVEKADAPDAGSIPWLLLEATDHTGTGAFSTITYVQRLDTIGGVAPAEGCDAGHSGDELRAPYQATYAFYYTSGAMNTATPTS